MSGLVRIGLLGLLNPIVAGAAMALSSVSVVGNALRLRRFAPAQDVEAPSPYRARTTSPAPKPSATKKAANVIE
jgi:P-type Cu+ transporter